MTDFTIELLDSCDNELGVEVKGVFDWSHDGSDGEGLGCYSVNADNTTFEMRFCCADTGKFTDWISCGVDKANDMSVLDALTTYHQIDIEEVIDAKYRPIFKEEREQAEEGVCQLAYFMGSFS